MRKITILILICSLLLIPNKLAAQSNELIDGNDIEPIIKLARQFGSATLAYQNDGNPKIIGKINNIPYTIRMRNCEREKICEDMNFRVGFLIKPDIEVMNSWNRGKRFSRAYLDEEGDAILEMDIIIKGGVSEENLSKTFAYWRLSLVGFTEHIGFK